MTQHEFDKLVRTLLEQALVASVDAVEPLLAQWRNEHGSEVAHEVRRRYEAISHTFQTFTKLGFDTYTLHPNSARTEQAREANLPELGGYALRQLIGAGGNGVVFRAVNKAAPQIVRAVKVIMPWQVDADAVERLKREAIILDRLLNRHIVRLFDVGQLGAGSASIPYIVMELVDGDAITLESNRRQLALDQRIELLTQVLDGLAAAHRQGIAHYDLKPGNVLLDSNNVVKIVDFGLAMDVTRAPSRPMGWTYAYAPPEQIDLADQRYGLPSDVFSVGVLGYELLTGARPYAFEAGNLTERAKLLRDAKPPALPRTRTSRELKIDRVLRNAMDPTVEARYKDAQDLKEDFERALAGRLVRNEERTAISVGRSFYVEHRRPVHVAAVVGTALLLGLVGTTWQMVVAGEQRAIAQRSQAEAEASAQSMARALDFVRETLFDLDTYRTGSQVADLRFIFQGAQARLATLGSDRLAKAMVLQALGRVAANRGYYDFGVRFLEESETLWNELVTDSGSKPLVQRAQVSERARTLNWLAWALSEGGRASKIRRDDQRILASAREAFTLTKDTFGTGDENTIAYWADFARLKQLHGGPLGAVAAMNEYLACVSVALGYGTIEEFTDKLRAVARQTSELVANGQNTEAHAAILRFVDPLMSDARPRLKTRVPWSMSQMAEELASKPALIKSILAPEMSEHELRLVALAMAETAADLAERGREGTDLPNVTKTRDALARVRAMVPRTRESD